MIPKIIHYCWFGGNSLPESAKKCIESWKSFFPDYEIKQWNEQNFDVNICDYCREAYEAKKWAFVSDYARFWILYKYGGIYFDTDVEVIADFRDIISGGPFMGCEQTINGAVMANPGLGLAMNPHEPFLKTILDTYEKAHFDISDETKLKTVVDYTTELLMKEGFQGNNTTEQAAGLTIYPTDYFCPMNQESGEINITENTRSIHHYTASWQSPYKRLKSKIKRIIGKKATDRIIRIKRKFLGKGKST